MSQTINRPPLGGIARRLEGKVILVTAGGGAIGRATCRALAEEGAIVVIVDRSEDNGLETLAQVKAAEARGTFWHLDLSVPGEPKRMVDLTLEKYGRLDGAFNNLGIRGILASFVDYSDYDFDLLFGINLKISWQCMKAELNAMVKQKSGVIVNHASVAANRALPHLSLYGAAKAGMSALTRSVAIEYAHLGIRANTICPGLIRTPDLEQAFLETPALEAEFIRAHPIGRLGTPSEVGRVASWLFSDAASFITGESIAVDGGLMAR